MNAGTSSNLKALTEAIEAIETLASPVRAFVGDVCEVGMGLK